mgnify:CR=1 FL=1
MYTLEKIKDIVKTHERAIKNNFKVKRIGIFGSYVRGEQTKKSDLDILVDFSRSVGLFNFVRLKDYLSDILNHEVDLVQKGAMKPHIEKHALKGMIKIL